MPGPIVPSPGQPRLPLDSGGQPERRDRREKGPPSDRRGLPLHAIPNTWFGAALRDEAGRSVEQSAQLALHFKKGEQKEVRDEKAADRCGVLLHRRASSRRPTNWEECALLRPGDSPDTRSARCIFCIESGRNNGHFRPTRSIEKTRASGVSPGKDQTKSEAPPLFHISSTCGPRLRRITEIRLCVSEAGALRICSLWAPLLIKIGASV